MEKIIRTLDSIREAKNISYDDIANAVGLTRTNVWRILNSKSVPRFDNICKIAEFLDHEIELTSKEVIRELVVKAKNKLKKDCKKSKVTINDISRGDAPDELHEKFIESKLEDGKCQNCTYQTMKSGLTIRIKKCDNCKKAKK